MPLTEQPQKGQRIAWRLDGELKHYGTVRSIDGSLCWVDHDDGTVGPFIWRFRKGLNELAEVIELGSEPSRRRTKGESPEGRESVSGNATNVAAAQSVQEPRLVHET